MIVDVIAPVSDPEIIAIKARMLRAKASTDPAVAVLGADLEYLVERLSAAEAAAEAGAEYARAAAPHLRESFTRTVLAEHADVLRIALVRWREAR